MLLLLLLVLQLLLLLLLLFWTSAPQAQVYTHDHQSTARCQEFTPFLTSSFHVVATSMSLLSETGKRRIARPPTARRTPKGPTWGGRARTINGIVKNAFQNGQKGRFVGRNLKFETKIIFARKPWYFAWLKSHHPFHRGFELKHYCMPLQIVMKWLTFLFKYLILESKYFY